MVECLISNTEFSGINKTLTDVCKWSRDKPVSIFTNDETSFWCIVCCLLVRCSLTVFIISVVPKSS
jgi:hypothetical protein